MVTQKQQHNERGLGVEEHSMTTPQKAFVKWLEANPTTFLAAQYKLTQLNDAMTANANEAAARQSKQQAEERKKEIEIVDKIR